MAADGADGDGGAKQRFELYIKVSNFFGYVEFLSLNFHNIFEEWRLVCTEPSPHKRSAVGGSKEIAFEDLRCVTRHARILRHILACTDWCIPMLTGLSWRGSTVLQCRRATIRTAHSHIRNDPWIRLRVIFTDNLEQTAETGFEPCFSLATEFTGSTKYMWCWSNVDAVIRHGVVGFNIIYVVVSLKKTTNNKKRVCRGCDGAFHWSQLMWTP